MRTYDEDEIAELNAEQWQINLLKLNPEYVHWGPYEDYMTEKKAQWSSGIFEDSWQDFGPWSLDDLNELVNFYFEVNRASKDCPDCDGTGYGPETKILSDEWYSFGKEEWVNIDGTRRYNSLAHSNNITQIEVDALWEAKRLRDFKEKPTPEQVNEWNQKGRGHDAINKWICLEALAKEKGYVYRCEECDGKAYIYTAPNSTASLVLWFLHPRKGCSRGVEVKNILESDLPAIFEYLQEAATRNADRFSKIPHKEPTQ